MSNDFVMKYLDGTPVSEAYQAQVTRAIDGAVRAESVIGIDELERFAATGRTDTRPVNPLAAWPKVASENDLPPLSGYVVTEYVRFADMPDHATFKGPHGEVVMKLCSGLAALCVYPYSALDVLDNGLFELVPNPHTEVLL